MGEGGAALKKKKAKTAFNLPRFIQKENKFRLIFHGRKTKATALCIKEWMFSLHQLLVMRLLNGFILFFFIRLSLLRCLDSFVYVHV